MKRKKKILWVFWVESASGKSVRLEAPAFPPSGQNPSSTFSWRFPLTQIVELEHEADVITAVGRQLSGIVVTDPLAIHDDRAAARGIHTAQNIQNRAFPRSAGAGDHDELYFRDYLQEHPDVAKEYETLKRRLWKEFEHNRDSYTDAKTEFVLEYTKRAKAKYQGRY